MRGRISGSPAELKAKTSAMLLLWTYSGTEACILQHVVTLQHVEESGLGTVFAAGTRFQLPGRVQAPALAFVRAGAAKDVPDLVVEFVTSPRHEAAVAGWLSAGVKAVLEVDPSARTVSVLRGQDARVYGEADSLELPDIVPGWSLRVGELFN
jgi:Uma2 family endonuclease